VGISTEKPIELRRFSDSRSHIIIPHQKIFVGLRQPLQSLSTSHYIFPDTYSIHRYSIAKMGYGKTDELAINTIRLLAVCDSLHLQNYPSFSGGQLTEAINGSQLGTKQFLKRLKN
jgi:hypothetical protein